jgi:(S)-sulfolactate dehydrogenase
MKILITEVMDSDSVGSLEKRFDVVYDPRLHERVDDVKRQLVDSDGLIVKERTQVTHELIADAARLRAVGRLGAGLDNIDVAACRARGIKVLVAAGANAASVAEYVLCTALTMVRPGAYSVTRDVCEGLWPQDKARKGRELADKTLGILGFGHVGKRIAALAAAFDVTVLVWAPTKTPESPEWNTQYVRFVGLDELLAAADIVSVNVPLNAQTRRLMSRDRIAAMKKGAALINTARGEIVDEAALADALKAGHLSGAAIDVFAREPLGPGSVYSGVPNLILSPHIAGGTVESAKRRGSLIADAVADALSP